MKVILNEQHKLTEEQKEILNNFGGRVEIISVPANGWTDEEMEKNAHDLYGHDVIFVSPIPILIGMLSFQLGWKEGAGRFGNEVIEGPRSVYIFHNNYREKKELPNGKIIMVVAKTGWKLKAIL